MPGFNGKGPHGSGRAGSGRRQRLGSGRNTTGQARTNRKANCITDDNFVIKAMQTHPYIYQYSLEELKERKQELETEIQWLNDRIKELEATEK